jgi:CO/xanthine dehydrogenase FAD-binding subunit
VRAFLPAYELYAPSSVAEALERLSAEPGRWRPFAGGTDLMVQLENGSLAEGRYLGLWKLAEWRGIREMADGLEIGALTTYTDVLSNAAVGRDFPLLQSAAAETGGVATQNRGTLGGNIANASPAADTPPALLVYDAELELISTRGTRRVPYEQFHLGYKKMDLAPDELIAHIRLPKRTGDWRDHYRKVGTRRAQAISKVCLAGSLCMRRGTVEDVRIAFGSVAPTVILAREAEAVLAGKPLDRSTIAAVTQAIAGGVAPIDDVRSTARYRRSVAQRLVSAWLTSEVEGGGT